MVRKGNLDIFESSNISETKKPTPIKIGVHAFDINSYLHKFFEPILIRSIFSLPWTIVHGKKGNLAIFESSNISETKKVMPIKIGVHAFDINPYLHKFFEPILIDSIFSLPWTIVHGKKGKFGRF